LPTIHFCGSERTGTSSFCCTGELLALSRAKSTRAGAGKQRKSGGVWLLSDTASTVRVDRHTYEERASWFTGERAIGLGDGVELCGTGQGAVKAGFRVNASSPRFNAPRWERLAGTRQDR